jgi:hypothetical protein
MKLIKSSALLTGLIVLQCALSASQKQMTRRKTDCITQVLGETIRRKVVRSSIKLEGDGQIPDMCILRMNDVGKCSLYYKNQSFSVSSDNGICSISKDNIDETLSQLDCKTMGNYLAIGKIGASKGTDQQMMLRAIMMGNGGMGHVWSSWGSWFAERMLDVLFFRLCGKAIEKVPVVVDGLCQGFSGGSTVPSEMRLELVAAGYKEVAPGKWTMTDILQGKLPDSTTHGTVYTSMASMPQDMRHYLQEAQFHKARGELESYIAQQTPQAPGVIQTSYKTHKTITSAQGYTNIETTVTPHGTTYVDSLTYRNDGSCMRSSNSYPTPHTLMVPSKNGTVSTIPAPTALKDTMNEACHRVSAKGMAETASEQALRLLHPSDPKHYCDKIGKVCRVLPVPDYAQQVSHAKYAISTTVSNTKGFIEKALGASLFNSTVQDVATGAFKQGAIGATVRVSAALIAASFGYDFDGAVFTPRLAKIASATGVLAGGDDTILDKGAEGLGLATVAAGAFGYEGLKYIFKTGVYYGLRLVPITTP